MVAADVRAHVLRAAPQFLFAVVLMLAACLAVRSAVSHEIVRDHLNSELLKLWATTQKTIAFVTHSIPEAVYLSTKIVVMSPRPGRVTDIIDSPLPRDRPLEIRETPEFLAIAHRVREGLRAGHSYEV